MTLAPYTRRSRAAAPWPWRAAHRSIDANGWSADAPCVNQLRDLQVVTACALLPTELGLRFQGFDTRFRNSCEDVDLCLRMKVEGYRVSAGRPASSCTTSRRRAPMQIGRTCCACRHLWAGKVAADESAVYATTGTPTWPSSPNGALECERLDSSERLEGIYGPAQPTGWQAEVALVPLRRPVLSARSSSRRHEEMRSTVIIAHAVATAAMSISAALRPNTSPACRLPAGSLDAVLKLVLPKDRWRRQRSELFEAADLPVVRSSSVDYKASIADPRISEVRILRPQEIPTYDIRRACSTSVSPVAIGWRRPPARSSASAS